MPALHTHLLSKKDAGGRVLDLAFELLHPTSLPFSPGQFVTLAVGKDVAGGDLRRSYSIASSPGEPLRLLLRLVPGGVGSGFFAALVPGAKVTMTGPHGFFTLLPSHPGDVLFAATGTGIAPVLSMLAALAKRPEGGRRVLRWGLRRQEDLFLVEEVTEAAAAAGAELAVHLSHPSPGWTGPLGRITSSVLAALPELRAPTFYLVGNGAMCDELKRALVAAGVDRKRQIRAESFTD
jgi:ferredoxin-NADP reductase